MPTDNLRAAAEAGAPPSPSPASAGALVASCKIRPGTFFAPENVTVLCNVM